MSQDKSLQQLDEYIQKGEDNIVKFNLLQNIAVATVAGGKLEYASQLYTQALSIAEKLNDDQSRCNILFNLGLTAENLNKIDLAIGYYKQALEIAKDIRDFKVQSQTCAKLGIIYMSMGNLDIANLDIAATYFEQARDAAQIAKPSTVTVRAEHTEDNSSISDHTTRSTNLFPIIQKSIEVSNEIKQVKQIHTDQRRITIIVGIFIAFFIIIFFFYSFNHSNLFYAVSAVVIFICIILICLNFV